MNIQELGGEFSLLKRIVRPVDGRGVVVGPSDDCAVLDYDAENYLLLTTDMLVEENHFSLRWSTPFQVGKKLVECNVSDIVSMGGTPLHAVVSIALKKETPVEFVDGLYRGIYSAAKRHGVQIVGGDTVRGKEYSFNLALLGTVPKALYRLRSGAKSGELLCVTGRLGGSAAGLELLKRGKNGSTKKHLEPESRLASEGQAIARFASAMIDVSDGLASEARHFCEQSKVGAVIEAEKVPLASEALSAASALGCSALDFALYGGEDYELLFAIAEEKVAVLRKEFDDFSVIGRIVAASEGLCLLEGREKKALGKGFDHFAGK